MAVRIELVHINHIKGKDDQQGQCKGKQTKSLGIHIAFQRDTVSPQSHPEPNLSFAVLHTKPESADDAKEDIYQHKDHQGDFVIRLPFFLTQLLFTERGDRGNAVDIKIVDLQPLSHSVQEQVHLVRRIRTFHPNTELCAAGTEATDS